MLIRNEQNIVVNLKNVSNIYIDRYNNRIIFNMKSSVKLDGTLKADYVYWYCKDLKKTLTSLEKKLEEVGFIIPNSIYNRYVNPETVNSVKVDEKNLKIIYNFNCTVTHPEDSKMVSLGEDIPFDKQRMVSDFAFIKFKNLDDFRDYLKKLDNNFIYSI